MNFKLTPLNKIALWLFVMSLTAFALNPSEAVALHLLPTLGFALVLYWLFSTFSSKHKNVWDTITSSLIIFLVLHYSEAPIEFVYPLIAIFIAMIIKFFVEYRGSPIVNPAAAGLLLMAAIAGFVPGLEQPFISWWGAAFGGYTSLALVALWMAFGVHQWRKWPTVLSFLIVHAIVLVLKGQPLDFIQYTFTDSTVYFFVAVMLIEPKTSPLKTRDQGLYGGGAAIAYNVFLQYGVPYAALFAIIAANLGNVLLRPRFKKKSK